MRRTLLLSSFCLALASLAGCGNKGPLVLPPSRSAPATSAPVPVVPATAASSATPAASQP